MPPEERFWFASSSAAESPAATAAEEDQQPLGSAALAQLGSRHVVFLGGVFATGISFSGATLGPLLLTGGACSADLDWVESSEFVPDACCAENTTGAANTNRAAAKINPRRCRGTSMPNILRSSLPAGARSNHVSGPCSQNPCSGYKLWRARRWNDQDLKLKKRAVQVTDGSSRSPRGRRKGKEYSNPARCR